MTKGHSKCSTFKLEFSVNSVYINTEGNLSLYNKVATEVQKQDWFIYSPKEDIWTLVLMLKYVNSLFLKLIVQDSHEDITEKN